MRDRKTVPPMNRRSILSRLVREARPYYPRLGLAMTMGVLAGVLSIVPPIAFRIIINDVLIPPHGRSPDLKALYLALGLTAVALVLANCAIYGQTYLTAWSGQHLVARIRVRLFDRLLNLPLGEFDKWRPGELMARFSTDLQIMIDAVSVSVPQLVVALATFASSFATMIYLDWLLTLSLVLVAPIVSLAVSNFQRLISASTHRAQQRIADLTANLAEILGGQRVVKSFAREEFEVARFRNRNDDFFGAYMKLTQFIQTQPLVISTIMVMAVVAIMWLSVREVLVGRLDTGRVFMYWGLLVNLMNPMNRVAAFFGDISKAVVGAGRVLELLDLPVEVRDPVGAVPLPPVRGRIEYVDVTFRYRPKSRPHLATSTLPSRRERSSHWSDLRAPARRRSSTSCRVFISPKRVASFSTESTSRRCGSPICARRSRSFRKTCNSSAARFSRTFVTAASTRPTTKCARPRATLMSTSTFKAFRTVMPRKLESAACASQAASASASRSRGQSCETLAS